MTELVTLSVRGKTYEGWKQVSVSRSIKAVSASFSLSLTDNWTEANKPWILIPGDKCEIKSNGETVVRGYIDTVESSYDSRQRTLTVSGREVTGDLVDCSVDYAKTTEIAGIGLYQLAKRLCKPFGITVRNDAGTTQLIEKVSINPGDTVHQVLDRYSRQVGALLTSDGKGTLVIQKLGQTSAQAQFIEGQNILSASSTFSTKNRFNEYRVTAQNSFSGLDQELQLSCIGRSYDSEITRKRLLVVQAETASTPELCRSRAKWENAHRKGESVNVSVRVQGWRLADGQLLQPNRLYKISSPWIGIDDELLLEELTLTQSVQGTVAEIGFTRKDAYLPEGFAKSKKSEVDLLKKLIQDNSKKK